MATKEELVKVIVRCRPMSESEHTRGCQPVLSIDGKGGSCTVTKQDSDRLGRKQFTFDRAYSGDTTTQHIYSDIVCPIVKSVTEGYNGTIVAYGQTASGKTFTMQGVSEPSTQLGIIPRAVDDIFKNVSSNKSQQWVVHCSCYEIYNEEIRDLLGKSLTEKLDIGSFPNKGFYVKATPSSPSALRRTGPEDKRTYQSGQTQPCGSGRSERQKQDWSRRREVQGRIKINNSSLSRKSHLNISRGQEPTYTLYRDSKLTKLLQDSLGGNARAH
ncbi:kinesin-like protein KIF17 [Haliotis rubra]|uniref:kinesin-like protein KIF17 n=1 Tax=Haliotis rubra TaxID=36100 RepID=UPI001EE60671|nr:kinesin-like protein KIF17 [Haliotis rubra]